MKVKREQLHRLLSIVLLKGKGREKNGFCLLFLQDGECEDIVFPQNK